MIQPAAQQPIPTPENRDLGAALMGLTEQERRFVVGCVTHGNRTRAYKEAGFEGAFPAQEAHELATKGYIAEAIRKVMGAEIGGLTGIQARIKSHADATIRDYEPWLRGLATLEELGRAGVDMQAVKSASIRTGRDGETHRIELYDAQEAAWKLARLGGYVDAQAPAPDTPRVVVNVDLVNLLADRMAAAVRQPSVPGLAPPRLTNDGPGTTAPPPAEAEGR